MAISLVGVYANAKALRAAQCVSNLKTSLPDLISCAREMSHLIFPGALLGSGVQGLTKL